MQRYFRKYFAYLTLSILSISINLSFASAENTPEAPAIKTFTANSLSQIINSHSSQPFILIVWSIDCLPCRQEFDMLAEVKRQFPALKLSIVATESLKDFPQLVEILKEHQLLEQDNWAFAETHSAELRYQLDPSWYGELPRAYFYNQQHERLAISGKLEQSEVVAWWQKVN